MKLFSPDGNLRNGTLPSLVSRISYRDPCRLSKLSEFRPQEPELFSVMDLRSPTELVLSGNKEVKLVGLREIPEKREAAIEFLWRKTKNQRVFFRTDSNLRAENGVLPVYLYLKNRTHLNAHLIKRGLALVDETAEFKQKERFLKYQAEARERKRDGFE